MTTKADVLFPKYLLEQFEKTSFCPDDLIRGREETGIAWNSLTVEYDEGSESSYPSTAMYYVLHHEGITKRAERPFAEWSGSKDGQFVKAVIDWLQSMTIARQHQSGAPA